MSTASHPPFVIVAEGSRRAGRAWLFGNVLRLVRMLYNNVLTSFIGFLGSISTPGMRPVGRLQAWALRRLGVDCPSNLVWIGPRFALDYPAGLSLGERVVIGADTRLTARARIVIGDDFLSAPGLAINTGTHDVNTFAPQVAPVTIGPGVWCGQRVTVCAGVTIGHGTVVGAGAVVIRSLPPRHVCAGVPCRPIRPLGVHSSVPPPWSNFPAS
jgi:acetyltransferase-like isoleucine patch superfamily enzyme